MKKSIITPAILFSLCLIPTSSFANYYSYLGCMNGGGNWFSCLGELASDNGEIMGPKVEEDFKFLLNHKESAVLQSIKENEQQCGKYKEEERVQCYLKTLKNDLEGEERSLKREK